MIVNRYNNLLDSYNYPQSSYEIIYKQGTKYKSYSLDLESNQYNEFSFTKTASSNVFLMKLLYKPSYNESNGNAVLTNGTLLEFSYEKPHVQLRIEYENVPDNGDKMYFEHQWLKIFPTAEDYKVTQKTSGTGFAVSTQGIIVTNYHVIENASTIKVRGINGKFDKAYKAKILTSDKNNDLALLQIDDISFSKINDIPYVINFQTSSVGENIYALGYPLRAIMGDEIKLTNGIISSKTGFQGDITSYQVSAPIQPGNSGGPLFDSNGNVVGIINAKLTVAENASYAIKTSYLYNLIGILDETPLLQKENKLNGLNLSTQVSKVKEFVYIIECE